MSPHLKFAALLLSIACAAPVPVEARTGFDGRWSVSATVDDGGCTGPYRYPIVVRDGIVDDASGSGADASGRVGKGGRLVGSIRSGLASIAVEGRLRTSAGSGRWNMAGPISCSGRWTASRSG
ncbi:hypothetical protein [Methylobacterium sp. WL8]|uniref:hypothetical protein n=1 Tax=Methylobacterium sp. WL8 TaxID=2603899 RepID=UPI0011CB470A|nr:hypothetical protein [Methylobacterium sp. WL8]TXN81119.1 hypothetical protein FV234_14610 [Methylobacterium sp. WL8]